MRIDDHSRKDDHSSLLGDTEHNEGTDAMTFAKLQIAEGKIELLESRLKDKDALLASKDETIISLKAEIENMRKTLDYLMGQK